MCKKVVLWILKTPKDSRIFDEFCALREKAQGSYLSGNDRRAFLTLAQKSQNKRSEVSLEKAESTNPKQATRSFFRKANAKGGKNA